MGYGQVSDIPEIVDLITKVEAQEFGHDVPQAAKVALNTYLDRLIQSPRARVYVVYQQDELIGTGMLLPLSRQGYTDAKAYRLTNLYTRYHGQGLGTHLMDAWIFPDLKTLGATDVLLETSKPRAARWYEEKYGFRPWRGPFKQLYEACIKKTSNQMLVRQQTFYELNLKPEDPWGDRLAGHWPGWLWPSVGRYLAQWKQPNTP